MHKNKNFYENIKKRYENLSITGLFMATTCDPLDSLWDSSTTFNTPAIVGPSCPASQNGQWQIV